MGSRSIGLLASHRKRTTNVANGLNWTWADGNTRECTCPKTGLHHFPYTTRSLDLKVACFLSHYAIWQACVTEDETFLILEHDAVFIRALPDITLNGICQINDPAGATRKGKWWSDQMRKRGGEGLFMKTVVPSDKNIPDGLAGNSAYLIRPWAAQFLIQKTHELGIWPNDGLMCRQLFPGLQEYYPFITRVEQESSTTT